jgi:hypothetical protein
MGRNKVKEIGNSEGFALIENTHVVVFDRVSNVRISRRVVALMVAHENS